MKHNLETSQAMRDRTDSVLHWTAVEQAKLDPGAPLDDLGASSDLALGRAERTHVVKGNRQASPVAVQHSNDARCPATIDDSSEGQITLVELKDENDGPSVRVLVGRRIGRYELVRRCPSDGIGSLWQAQCQERPMMLRIVRHSRWNDRTWENQWLLAATRSARLRHRGIAPIREVACLRKCTLIASDWVPGRTLSKAIAKSHFDTRHAVTLMIAVAEALDYAHSRGAVHGDLTPDRITLKPVTARPQGARRPSGCSEQSSASSATKPIRAATSLPDSGYCQRTFDEQPVITGFTAVSCDSGVTSPGRRGFSSKQLVYASPERVQAEASLDGRMDIYSAGVILFELLTGELPFRGVPEVIIPRIVHESPTAPQLLNPAIDHELEKIVLRCLAKQPSARYSAGELAQELRRWLDADRANQFKKATKRRRPTAALTILVFFAVSLLGWPLTIRLRSGIAASNGPSQTNSTVEPHEPIDSTKPISNQAASVIATSNVTPDEMKQSTYRSRDTLQRETVEPVPVASDPAESAGPTDEAESDSSMKDSPEHLNSTRLYQTARRVRKIETPDQALEANQKAREALEKLLVNEPSSIDTRGFLATTYLDVAQLQHRTGRSMESESSLHRARKLLEDWPDQERSGDRGRWLGALYFELAQVQVQFRQAEPAVVSYQNSLKVRAALATDDPKNIRVREDLAETYGGLALHLARLHRATESRDYLENARRTLQQLASGGTESPGHLCDWARFWNNVGCTEFALGDRRSAHESFERARVLFEQAAIGDQEATELIAQCHTNRGIAQRAAGEYDAAKRSFDRAAEIRAKLRSKEIESDDESSHSKKEEVIGNR